MKLINFIVEEWIWWSVEASNWLFCQYKWRPSPGHVFLNDLHGAACVPGTPAAADTLRPDDVTWTGDPWKLAQQQRLGPFLGALLFSATGGARADRSDQTRIHTDPPCGQTWFLKPSEKKLNAARLENMEPSWSDYRHNSGSSWETTSNALQYYC